MEFKYLSLYNNKYKVFKNRLSPGKMTVLGLGKKKKKKKKRHLNVYDFLERFCFSPGALWE